LVSEVRGTLGADVYTRIKSGGIVRTQTTNEWVNTTLRGLALDYRTLVTQGWSTTLSQTQRDAWNAFAAMQSRAHTAIAQTQLSGHAWFVKLNIPLARWFEAFIPEPPPHLLVDPLTSLAIANISVAATQFNIAWQPPLADDHALIVQASPSVSTGVSSWLKTIGYAGAFYTDALTTGNIWDEYNLYHAAPTPDLKIGIVARLLNPVNGCYSRPLRAEAIVSA
jgi:hypothetical protein